MLSEKVLEKFIKNEEDLLQDVMNGCDYNSQEEVHTLRRAFCICIASDIV